MRVTLAERQWAMRKLLQIAGHLTMAEVQELSTLLDSYARAVEGIYSDKQGGFGWRSVWIKRMLRVILRIPEQEN